MRKMKASKLFNDIKVYVTDFIKFLDDANYEGYGNEALKTNEKWFYDELKKYCQTYNLN